MTNYFEPQTEQRKYLPESFDLLQFTGGIENQGQTYNCVGCATVSLLEILLAEAGRPEELSTLYPYYYGRSEYPSMSEIDKGMPINGGLESTIYHGIPSAAMWGDPAKINIEPSTLAQQDATRNAMSGYLVVDTNNVVGDEISNIKLALAWGYPVLTSIRLSTQFSTLEENEVYTGLVNISDFAGDHALVAIGYDSDSILYENSWGTQWGDGGYVDIPNEVVRRDVTSMMIVTDFSSFDLSADEAVINGLYLTALDRPADSGGLEYWASQHDQGASFRDIARAFYQSGEHKGNNPGDDFVVDAYQEILGREPDAIGYNYWSTAPAIELVGTFYASPEFIAGW